MELVKGKTYLQVDAWHNTTIKYKALENEFQEIKRDWNNDNDIYTLEVSLFEDEYGYREYITKDSFNRHFKEYAEN